MPCCQTVLIAAAASRTPSWLHRLHAKEGLSFPSHLRIDDLLYGSQQLQPSAPQLALPPPSSAQHPEPAVIKELPPPKAAKPKQQQRPPRNPTRPNPSSSNSPQPQPQQHLTAVISDVFAINSSVPPDIPALKAFRKQSRPRPRTDDQETPASLPGPRKDKIAKAKKRRRAERARDADGERFSRTDVTVIDTSTKDWKAAKVLIRWGDVWKVRDKKLSATSENEDALAKGKRRAGLVSKLQRDREKQKEKEATSSVKEEENMELMLIEARNAGHTVDVSLQNRLKEQTVQPGRSKENIDAGSDFVLKEDPMHTLNRSSIYSEAEPKGWNAAILQS